MLDFIGYGIRIEYWSFYKMVAQSASGSVAQCAVPEVSLFGVSDEFRAVANIYLAGSNGESNRAIGVAFPKKNLLLGWTRCFCSGCG